MMASDKNIIEKNDKVFSDIEFENSLLKDVVMYDAILYFKVNVTKDLICERNIINHN